MVIPATARRSVWRYGVARRRAIGEITFNSSLLHELRAIDFVGRMLDAGQLDPQEFRKMYIHILHGSKESRQLDASFKVNAEWAFLQDLFAIGRAKATLRLDSRFDDLGRRTSVDIREKFQGVGSLPASEAAPPPENGITPCTTLSGRLCAATDPVRSHGRSRCWGSTSEGLQG